MTAPTVAARGTGANTTSQTDQVVTFDSATAGQLIIVWVAGGTSSTFTWPGSWVEKADFEIATGEQESLTIGRLKATGGETSVTVAASVATRSAWGWLLINGAADPATQDIDIATTSGGGSPECDPPNLAPAAGAKDYLWIAIAASANGGTFTAAPTDYSNLQTSNTGGTTSSHSAAGSAERTLNTTSQNPAAFTHDDASTRDWCAATIAVHPASGQTVTVNQNTETDTSQPVNRQKIKAAGQNTETDLSQTINRSKTKAIGQNSETELAQAVARIKILAVAQVSETDTAQPITRDSGQIIVPVTQVTETDTPQSLTARKTALIAQVSETDIPSAITSRKITSLSQISETDAAQTITTRKIVALVQASETDAPQTLTHRKVKELAQTVETDAAQAITAQGAILVQQVIETDLAQALFPLKRVTIAQVFETDTVQTMAHQKIKTAGQALEMDESFSMSIVGGTIGVNDIGRVVKTWMKARRRRIKKGI